MESIEEKTERFRKSSARADVLRGLAWVAAGRLWAGPPLDLHPTSLRPNEYQGTARFFDSVITQLDQHENTDEVSPESLLRTACDELLVPGMTGTQRYVAEIGILLGLQSMATVDPDDLTYPLHPTFVTHAAEQMGVDVVDRFINAAI